MGHERNNRKTSRRQRIRFRSFGCAWNLSGISPVWESKTHPTTANGQRPTANGQRPTTNNSLLSLNKRSSVDTWEVKGIGTTGRGDQNGRKEGAGPHHLAPFLRFLGFCPLSLFRLCVCVCVRMCACVPALSCCLLRPTLPSVIAIMHQDSAMQGRRTDGLFVRWNSVELERRV